MSLRSKFCFYVALGAGISDWISPRGAWEGGAPYLFFNDLDGYEVEIWFE